MPSRTRTVILGGGLAGLSSAYHLDPERHQATVYEKSGAIGGTARSIRIQGFTFDITGHLLHLHFDYTKTLIQQLLAGNIFTCVRKAAIFSNGVLTEYPFQANTYGLPGSVVQACVEGFKKSVQKYSDPETRPTSLPFGTWSTRTFGKGIHKHFMKPYNEKLWRVKDRGMTAEWCGMFVPQPKLEDVVAGSKRRMKKAFGYNATFLYPQRGGIQVLSEALGKGLDVRLNSAAEEIDWREKKVRLTSGEWVAYDYLINTMPLVEIFHRMKGLPDAVAEAAARLKWTSVLCVNLGINRPAISDRSWIYFPEKKFTFYRVGFPMNFTPHAVPKGCSSMYVEVSYKPEKKLNWRDPKFLDRIRKDLMAAKILKGSDKILVADFIPLRYAYVLYTEDRKETLGILFNFLSKNSIQSIGRYGAWKYSFMEEAILDGKKAAEKINHPYPNPLPSMERGL